MRRDTLSPCGKTTTQKVEEYISLWKSRCYDDIPDEIHPKLERSGRVPSYKKIALCILNNDLQFKGLGFVYESSKADVIYYESIREKSNQIDMF